VSGSDRDLVLALRAELAAVDPARPCDRAAEAAALAVGIRRRGPGRDAPLARLLVRLGRDVPPSGPGSIAGFDWEAAAEHCRLAWLRGLFLARGSLSLAGGRTHLEFLVEREEAPLLARRLASVELPASWRVRRGRGVVTWKSGDVVGLFLRRIGATASLLEVEARQVSRALRGDLNRVLNAESANLQRAVGAAGRQVAAIDELTASGELGRQPFVVRSVAEARRDTPEATLGELAERLQIHRSAVQRALERIERLAATPPDDERGSWAGRSRRTATVGTTRPVVAPVGPSPGSPRPLA
jgi:WhiA C-terminal HTH domain/WhiA LAGLIDADG-like domain